MTLKGKIQMTNIFKSNKKYGDATSKIQTVGNSTEQMMRLFQTKQLRRDEGRRRKEGRKNLKVI